MNRLIWVGLLSLLVVNTASAEVSDKDAGAKTSLKKAMPIITPTPRIKPQNPADANAKITTTTETPVAKTETPPKPFNPRDYTVRLGTFQKKYPVVVAPSNEKLGIVYVSDINDNWQLAEEVSLHLINQLRSYSMLNRIEALVMPGDKANMVGTFLAEQLREVNPDLEFVIIRGDDKGGAFKTAEYQSVGSDTKKALYLREDQFNRIKGKRTLVFDDVLSSGSTLKAVTQLLTDANARVLAYACAATEGQNIDHFNGRKVFKTFYLPTYPNPNFVADKTAEPPLESGLGKDG